MKYMFLILADENARDPANDPDNTRMLPAYTAYIEAMRKAGILQGGERLRPTRTASTVRVKDGKPTVLDGPYAESREQLGGYFIIDVPDLDAALSWAARCPGASAGAIEVRPVWPMQPA